MLRVQGDSLEERIHAAWDACERLLAGTLEHLLKSETILHKALQLDIEAEQYLNEEYSPHPANYSRQPPDDEAEFSRLYKLPMDRLIDEVIETRGGSRAIATKSYFIDRRLEILAHVFNRHPAALADTRRRLGLLPPRGTAAVSRGPTLVSFRLCARPVGSADRPRPVFGPGPP
jgi:hypothetical protein